MTDVPRPDVEEIARAKLEAIIFTDEETPEVRKQVLLALARIINERHGAVAHAVKQKSPWEELNPEQVEALRSQLILTLRSRFDTPPAHYGEWMSSIKKGVTWRVIEKALKGADAKSLWSLNELEKSGGEVDLRAEEGDFLRFGDCSEESPLGRRDVTRDQAEAQAQGFGVELDTEARYRDMRRLGKFDQRTWSRLQTPALDRKLDLAVDGCTNGSATCVRTRHKDIHNFDGGWRGSIRIKKAS